MDVLLTQNMFFVPAHGGEAKANRAMLEGLAQCGHTCRAIVPAVGKQGPRTRQHFLDALSERGIHAPVFANGAAVFQYHGVEVHAVLDTPQLSRYLSQRLRDNPPTWVLVGSSDPGQVLLEAAERACPGRVVYLAHTMPLFPFGPKSFTPDPAKTALLRRAAGVLTVSTYVKTYMQQWGEIDSVVLPWPVYGARPFPYTDCFDRRFVTMINPCGYKGITIFLALARRFPAVQFAAVASWGTTEEDRQALALAPNVQVLAPVDDIDEIFAQTRVLLVPSLWGEGFPLVPVEAQVRGIPVLASDTGGLPEAVFDSTCVLPVREIQRYEEHTDGQGMPVPVLPEQDISPWEQALDALLSDRAEYTRRAQHTQRAAATFVAGVSVAPFETFLRELAPASHARQQDTSASTPEHANPQTLVRTLSPEALELLARRLRQTKDRRDT